MVSSKVCIRLWVGVSTSDSNAEISFNTSDCAAHFLASPDALEVIVVTHSLPDLLNVSTDLTDVTLVSDDTY